VSFTNVPPELLEENGATAGCEMRGSIKQPHKPMNARLPGQSLSSILFTGRIYLPTLIGLMALMFTDRQPATSPTRALVVPPEPRLVADTTCHQPRYGTGVFCTSSKSDRFDQELSQPHFPLMAFRYPNTVRSELEPVLCNFEK